MIFCYPPRTGRLLVVRTEPGPDALPPGVRRRAPRLAILLFLRPHPVRAAKHRPVASITLRTRHWSCNTQLHRRTASRARALRG